MYEQGKKEMVCYNRESNVGGDVKDVWRGKKKR